MRPVLLCYDGSDDARAAMRCAARLLAGREAIVLHVSASVVDWAIAPAIGPFLDIPGTDEAILGKARDVIAEGVACARDAGFTARSELRTTGGPVWRAVIEVAEEFDVACIVAGSHGLRLRDRLPLGSVAHGLVTHARRPLLVTHPADEQPLGTGEELRVLLAYDGSTTADAAIAALPDLLGTDADVDVAVAWRRPTDGVGIDTLRARARALSEQAAARVREAGNQAVPLSIPAHDGVGSALLDLAREIDADVLVLGTHGHGMATRALLGSAAHYVVQRARLPVLVVPPPVEILDEMQSHVDVVSSVPA